MRYANPDHTVIDAGDGRFVPTDPRNSDYAAIAASDVVISAFYQPPTVAALLAYAADKRWRVECGGCVSPDGFAIATDRDSQSKLLAEMVALGAGLRTDPSPWKLATGSFAMITNAQMLAIIMAVRGHIVSAFDRESAAIDVINAGTITTTAQIDAVL